MGWEKRRAVNAFRTILLILAFASRLEGTIYLAAHDPVTGSIGLAYSSSGGNFWQTRIKSRGLLGEQSYGLCQNATPAAFLNQGLSAEEVASSLTAQCDAEGWHDYRLAIVTADGAIASVIARNGCHPGNVTCGDRWGDHFLIIGGGLEARTLDAGLAAYEATDPDAPLACRLYRALRAVYAAGGEKKDFRGASITVDAPSAEQLFHIEARGAESTLLPTLDRALIKGGLTCDVQ